VELVVRLLLHCQERAGPLDLHIWDKLDGCAIPSKNGNHNDIGCLAQLEGAFLA